MTRAPVPRPLQRGRLVSAPVLLTQEEHALRPGVGENRARISDERYSCVGAAGLSLRVTECSDAVVQAGFELVD